MDPAPLIIDAGTVNTRMGIGGETVPTEVFPTIIGERKTEFATAVVDDNKTHFIGRDVLDKRRALLKVRYPVEMGLPKVTDEDLGLIIDHGTEMLGRKDAKGPKRTVLIEPMRATKRVRESLVEFMFESKRADELWLCSSAALSLFASGRTTGVVLEAGESASYVVPFLEGHALPRSRWARSDLSGMHITCFLEWLLQTKSRVETLPVHIMRSMKEQYCYTSFDIVDCKHEAMHAPESLTRIYTLPDGSEVSLGEERFNAGEFFFFPGIWQSSKTRAIHKTVVKTITDCDERLQPKLFQNIITVGGVSLMRGFQNRLQKEINVWLNGAEPGIAVKNRCKFTKSIQLVATEKNSVGNNVCIQAWRGGSLVSQLSSFADMKITPTDVAENGCGIIHKMEMVPAEPEKRGA